MNKYLITIESDNPDADELVQEATEKIATQVGWGDDFSCNIEAVRESPSETADLGDSADSRPLYLSGWYMEPGENNVNIERVGDDEAAGTGGGRRG